MPSSTILDEARHLYQVSERLGSLADEHPVVSDALVAISGSVRHTATLLEGLGLSRMVPPPGTAEA